MYTGILVPAVYVLVVPVHSAQCTRQEALLNDNGHDVLNVSMEGITCTVSMTLQPPCHWLKATVC